MADILEHSDESNFLRLIPCACWRYISIKVVNEIQIGIRSYEYNMIEASNCEKMYTYPIVNKYLYTSPLRFIQKCLC